jgi:hypothetical protein
MYLLRPRGQVRKGELKHEYVILVHNMEEDSFSGTCFMHDGRFVTLSWQEINKAFKKVKEDAYVISSKNEKLLRDLFDAVMTDVLTLENNIEASECAYQQQKEAAREAREAKRLVNHITIAGTPPHDALKTSEKINLDTVEEVVAPVEGVTVVPVAEVVTPVKEVTDAVEQVVAPVEDGAAVPVEKLLAPLQDLSKKSIWTQLKKSGQLLKSSPLFLMQML